MFRSLNEAISADVQHYSIQMQNLLKGKKNFRDRVERSIPTPEEICEKHMENKEASLKASHN